MGVLIWLHDKYLIDNQEAYELITYLQRNIDGLLITNQSESEKLYNGIKFPKSLLNLTTGHWREFLGRYSELNNSLYLGEMKTTQDYYIKNKSTFESVEGELQLLTHGKNVLVDEPDIDILREYKKYNCKVTFSNYRWYIKVLGFRIPIPFTNQLWAWKILEKEFGDRFDSVWIHIKSNRRDFYKLTKWANGHNKRIMLYCGDGDMANGELMDLLYKFLAERHYK